MPSRRDYLAALGGTVPVLAGCLSESDDRDGDGSDAETAPEDRTETGTADGTGTTTDDPADDLTVYDVAVKEAITYYHWPGSTTVYVSSDEQYVLATVSGPGTSDPPNFVFENGEESWDRTTVGRNREGPSTVAGRSGGQVGYGEDTDGTLAFLVPSPLSASEPRIRIEGTDASWALPDAARDRLATPPPSFALESLEVPDSVTRSDDVPVDLTDEPND